jgi:hypothetical protein
MPKLTISILVHNDFSHIYRALASIEQQTDTPCMIYVVINAGKIQQIEAIQAEFPHLNYIINEEPLGFAANHNQVIRQAETPYIALLNDDILIQDGALDKSITYLEAHPDVGMVSPQLMNEDGTYQVTAYSAPSLLRMIYKISGVARFTHQRSFIRKWLIRAGIGRIIQIESFSPGHISPTDVDVLKGATMIVRQATIDEVGLIDETTRVYGEEIDWNLRMHRKNWRTVLLPQAQIVHYEFVEDKLELKGWRIIEDRKSILNYYVKHRPIMEVWIIRVTILVFHVLHALTALFTASKDVKPHLQTALMGITWTRSKTTKQQQDS